MGIASSLLPHDGGAVIKGYPVASKFQSYPCSKLDSVPRNFDFGARLAENKAILRGHMSDADIRRDLRYLFMAMALRETATLSPCERDCTKDIPDTPSTNVSIFNANKDFIRHFSSFADFKKLNSLDGLYDMVRILDAAVRKWGVRKMLDFHRGGGTAMAMPWLPQLKPYRDAVASTVAALERDENLMKDNRQVWIDVPWIDDAMIAAAVARGH